MSMCARCQTPLTITMYASNRVGVATSLRCSRCGAVSAHLDGDVSIISPPMVPRGQGTKESPWMFPHTRPLVAGEYDCRFRGLERELTLHWNGSIFVASQADPRPVRMRTFLSWRGDWL